MWCDVSVSERRHHQRLVGPLIKVHAKTQRRDELAGQERRNTKNDFFLFLIPKLSAMYGKFIFGVLGVLSETGVRLLTFIHLFVQQAVVKGPWIRIPGKIRVSARRRASVACL